MRLGGPQRCTKFDADRWKIHFLAEKNEFKLGSMEGNIYAYSRKKSANGVGEFTPLHTRRIPMLGLRNFENVFRLRDYMHYDSTE